MLESRGSPDPSFFPVPRVLAVFPFFLFFFLFYLGSLSSSPFFACRIPSGSFLSSLFTVGATSSLPFLVSRLRGFVRALLAETLRAPARRSPIVARVFFASGIFVTRGRALFPLAPDVRCFFTRRRRCRRFFFSSNHVRFAWVGRETRARPFPPAVVRVVGPRKLLDLSFPPR